MRLNQWVRLGCLVTVLWAVIAAVYTHHAAVERANDWVKRSYDICTATRQADLSSCDTERLKAYETWMEGDKKNAAFVALAPIPFAWLATFILVYVVRVQLAGIRAVVPWNTLTRRKRWFVVFCFVAIGLTAVGTMLVGLNLYVDTKVPVGISPFQDLTKTGEDLVTVTGTWTRTDLTDDTIADPLQTSKIECDKAANRCTEALASVSGATLMSDVVDYDIQSWTPDAIVLRKDDLCATTLFTVDLNTKAVTGAGHATHENESFCKLGASEHKNWTLQLSNGFQTYWGLRQKARPWPLRVIQSMLGN